MITFDHPIIFGQLIRRYQRFFMEIERCDTKEVVVAHAPNTGSLLGLLVKGAPVMMTHHLNENRKLAYTVQGIKDGDAWVGINTHLPNRLMEDALKNKAFPEFSHYQSLKREVKYGLNNRSRIDIWLSESTQKKMPLYLEIKNVTLKIGERASFPDAVSLRARKHLEDLCTLIDQGFQAALFFVIQREDVARFGAAASIDPIYAQKLHEAHAHGLHIQCLTAQLSERGLALSGKVPLVID